MSAFPSSSLTALSPLDGRYASPMAPLRPTFSEFGLIKHRVEVELKWLLWLDKAGLLPNSLSFSQKTQDEIVLVLKSFSEAGAERVKAIEKQINHDVKAVEYWVREHFAGNPEISQAEEMIHFGCTSEDITNVAHALMLKAGRSVLWDALSSLVDRFRELAHLHADVPMVSRTHGQLATPTTLGKEMAIFCHRLMRARGAVSTVDLPAKFGGASGNYNAWMVAYPDVDWEACNKGFVESLGLTFNPYTTQIEPHDGLAELFDAIARVNTILIGADRDLWQYISLGYFKQRLKAGEVGSSTMPHKVNPIDFENAEGNLGLANSLLRHMAEKLPISRWQRDLTDSTVLRNMGPALGYSLLAYQSCLKGLGKLEVNRVCIAADINEAWELLAEPVQTVMRLHGVSSAYEQLKDLTRGKGVTKDALYQFISGLDIPDDAKERLLALTPATYIGLAAELAQRV